MQIEKLPIEGLIKFTPRVFRDERGFFLETFRQSHFEDAGVDVTFVQDNHSRSQKGTLRGLHFQSTPGQAKLIRCTQGKIWDVAVDIRMGSPTFGKYHAAELTDENHHQLFIPIGFAHGFLVLSEFAEVQYKCSSYYDGGTEMGIMWNDPEINIPWPIDNPILSERDQNLPTLAEYFS